MQLPAAGAVLFPSETTVVSVSPSDAPIIVSPGKIEAPEAQLFDKCTGAGSTGVQCHRSPPQYPAIVFSQRKQAPREARGGTKRGQRSQCQWSSGDYTDPAVKTGIATATATGASQSPFCQARGARFTRNGQLLQQLQRVLQGHGLLGCRHGGGVLHVRTA